MRKRDVLQSAIEVDRKRPKADLSIEQYLMTPESMVEQVFRLQNMMRGKKVLQLGDDDHLSILFAQYLEAQPIVAEYDSRIIDSLTGIYKADPNLDARIIEYDARTLLPVDILADLFYINPPYSSKNHGKGAMVWISRVANAVPVGSTSVLVYPIDEGLFWTLECFDKILKYAHECGLVVVGIDRDVHTYNYLPKDPGLLSSNIYLYKYANRAPKEIRDIDGNALYR